MSLPPPPPPGMPPPPPPGEWTPPPGSWGSGYGSASGPRAGFGYRLLGSIIDGLMLSAVDAIIQAGTNRLVSGIIGIVIGATYTILLLGSASGATLGMRAVGIRVIDADSGGRVEYGQCAIRYLVAIVSGLACGIGYLWMLWDPQKQTWHDKAANVYVVPTRFFPTPGSN